MKRAPGDHARIWPAYWETEYRFQRKDRWFVLRFGAPAWARSSDSPDLAASWGIITAWNPMSIALDADENHLRQVRLARAVADLGLRTDAALNRSPDGAWAEEGLVLWNVERGELLGLAHRFGQRAVVWGVSGRAGLLETPTERWISRSFGVVEC